MSNLVDQSNNRVHVVVIREGTELHKDLYTNAKGILHITFPDSLSEHHIAEIFNAFDRELSKDDGSIPMLMTPESIKVNYIKIE